MRVARLAAGPLLLWSAWAGAQDFRIVAEIGRAGGAGGALVRTLAPVGPPWVLSVSSTSVNAWPAGRVSEPVVSALPDTGPWGGPSAFGDFDGDGRLDLAVATPTGIAVLRGDGAGRFVVAWSFDVDRVRFIVAADVDGNGRTDLVTAPADQVPDPVISVYRSRGDFSFESPRPTLITDSYLGVQSLAAADVDGDGVVDLVVSPGKGGPRVWKGAGDGTFALTSALLTGYSVSTPLVADLDGDGRPEIIYGNAYPYTYMMPLEIQHNDGGGKFHIWAEPLMTRSVTGPFLGDFDGDGRPDVGFVDVDQSTGARFLAWYRASGGAVVEARVPLPSGASVAGLGDWDGDGKTDIFLYAPSGLAVLGRAGARTDVGVVPVLLSTTGLLGSRFDSDLLLTNAGTTPAHVTLRYTAAAGGGSGVVERDLAPGRQLFGPSAVSFLRDAGLAIPAEGNVIGTLRIETAGASAPRAVSASVRTTTPAGAGVAYGGTPLVALQRES